MSRSSSKYEITSTVQSESAEISARSGYLSSLWVSLLGSLWGGLFMGLLILATVFAPSSSVAQNDSTEYKIKAAMLYKFINFIEWPEDAYTNPSTPVTLCVLGEDPFGDSFADVVGHTVQGRQFEVTYLVNPQSGSPLDDCQILFFPSSMNDVAVQSALEKIADNPVLTVGESARFLKMGGMINFIDDGGKVRFEINIAPTEKTGIQIRSRLLRVAARVLGE